MTRPRQEVEPRQSRILDVDPVELAAAISQLPPNHALVVAARSAAEVSELRHDRKVALRDASKDIAGDKVWQGYSHRHLPHDEVARRRDEPGPMARIPEPREPAGAEEGDPRDRTAEACAAAREAADRAVAAREEAERAAQLNRWAADDAAAAAISAAAGDARVRL